MGRKEISFGPAAPVYIIPFSILGNHSSVLLSSGVYGLPIPSGARYLVMQSINGGTRMTMDGVNPTSSIGFLINKEMTMIPIPENISLKFYGPGDTMQFQFGE
jgi:hypothetical protein